MADDHLTYPHLTRQRSRSPKRFPSPTRQNGSSFQLLANLENNPLVSPANTFITTLNEAQSAEIQKNDIQEKQKLETYNYKLKMKVHGLKERIATHQQNEAKQQSTIHDYMNQVALLEKEIQEKTITIEEKDLILMKVLTQYESVKTTLLQHKAEIQQQLDFQEKMNLSRKVNRNNPNVAHHHQKIDYEQALLMTYIEHLTMKQEEISLIESQMREYEFLLKGRSRDRSLTSLKKEKVKIEASWTFSQERINLLEEEVNQHRAQYELLSSRVMKEKNTKHELQNQVKELLMKKSSLEEDHRRQLNEIYQQHTMQCESIKLQYEQEIEVLQREHQTFIKEIQEKSNQEQITMKLLYEKEMESLKSMENSEKIRQRDDLQGRITEKSEEVKSLKQQLETVQLRLERLLQENENNKGEIRQLQQSLQLSKQEIAQKADEVANLLPLKETVHTLQQKIIESQENVKKESMDKLQISFQRETATIQLQELQRQHKQLENEYQQLKLENHKLTYATSDLSTKKDMIDNFQREIEKYRDRITQLSNEILEGQYKYQHLLKEHETLKQEHLRDIQQQKASQEELKRHQQTIETLQASLQAEKEQLKKESERKAVAESLLQEIRENYSKLKVDYEAAKNQAVQENEEVLEEKEDWKQQVNDWIGIYLMMLHALQEWDESLVIIVEGENFRRSKSLSRTSSRVDMASSLASLYLSNGDRKSVNTPKGRRSQSFALNDRTRSRSPSRTRESTSSAADAKEEIMNLVDRISLKHDKIQNLRSFYHQEETRILQQFAQFSDKTASTLTQCQEQINRLSSELHHCQKVMSHDQQVLQQERQDFQALKEVLLKEHQEKYHQLEVKYTEVTMTLEAAQYQEEGLRAQIAQLVEEKQSLQSAVQSFVEEKKHIQQLETVIMQFHEKYDSIQQQYHSLEQQNQKYQFAIKQFETEKDLWRQEKESLQIENERLDIQIHLIKENAQDLERKYQQALYEIEKLELRPVDAEAALKLLTSQQQELNLTSSMKSTNRLVSASPGFVSPLTPNPKNVYDMIERLSPSRSSTRAESSVFNFSTAMNIREIQSSNHKSSENTAVSSILKNPDSQTPRTQRKPRQHLFIETNEDPINRLPDESSLKLEKLDRSFQMLSKKLENFR